MELSKQLKSIDRKFTYNTGKLPGFENGVLSLSDWLRADPRNYTDAQYNDDPYAKNPKLVTTKESYDKTVEDLNKKAFGQNQSNVNPGDKASMFIGGAASTISNTINAFTDYAHEDDILGARKTSTGYVGGIPYQMKTIDRSVLEYHKNGKLPKYAYGKNILNGVTSGASAGGTFGPWGAIIGGAVGGIAGGIGSMFASDSEAEALSNAQRYTANENHANLNSAATTRLQIDNAKKYGNGDTRIYRFAGGKSENVGLDGLTQLPKILHTINGVEIGKANAKVEPREGVSKVLPDGTVLFNRYDDGKIRSKRPGDILYTYTTPDETIWTNNRDPYTGIRFSDEAEARVRAGLPLDDLLVRMAEQQAAKKNGKLANAKCGKLPGHAEGWLGNAIPATAGILAGLGQYLDARNSKVYRPNTYSENPYELEGLTTLAGLRINPYPVMDELRKSEARTNRAIDIAGGLSGGQRAGARLANLNTTQNNISKLLQNIQQQNNAYKANYAQAAINAGQASRQARMQANQWDLDMYAKAHAARNRGMQTGIANMLAQIQQYQANEFKRRQFNDTMALYRDDLELRNKYMDWMQTHNGLNISQNADPIKNPSSQYWNQLLPSEKWLALYNRGIVG